MQLLLLGLAIPVQRCRPGAAGSDLARCGGGGAYRARAGTLPLYSHQSTDGRPDSVESAIHSEHRDAAVAQLAEAP